VLDAAYCDSDRAFVSALAGIPEGISLGPYFSGGIIINPNGQILSYASVGAQFGPGVGIPWVEYAAQITVIFKGLDGNALTGWGG
jgi:hypothetical protein